MVLVVDDVDVNVSEMRSSLSLSYSDKLDSANLMIDD